MSTFPISQHVLKGRFVLVDTGSGAVQRIISHAGKDGLSEIGRGHPLDLLT